MSQISKRDLKAQLRAQIREKRRALSPKMQSVYAQQLSDNLQQVLSGFMSTLTKVKGEKEERPVLGLYLPLKSEIDPCVFLDSEAFQSFYEVGGRTALPVVRGEELHFVPWVLGQETQKGAFGVEEPIKQDRSVDPSLLFVPLLAFTAQGGRLGWGGGFYDRYLQKRRNLRAQVGEDLISVGLAYAFQEVLSLPLEPHDQKLSAIVTEEAVFGSVR